jgi:anti-anti-sigma factor
MLHIRVAPVSPGEIVMVVRGELDCATSGQLRAAITALINRGGIDAIGLDLRGLDLLDSIGIGTIVVAQRICQQIGVHLRLTAVNPFTARVLDVMGLHEALALPARSDIQDPITIA